MNNTEYCQSSIISYLEGSSGEEERAALEAWLRESTANRELFFGLKALYDSGNKKDLSAQARDLMWSGIAEATGISREDVAAPGAIKRSRPIREFIRYAAIAAIALVTGYGISVYTGSRQEAAMNEIRMEAGTRSSVILADGTVVTINSSSTLRYPDRFGRKREVWLDGEAYFEVAPDKKHPFTVRSRQQAVNVLGTSFNIQAYPGDRYNTVTLLSGSVELELYDKAGNMIALEEMKPYDRIRFDLEEGLYAGTVLDDIDRQRSWKDGIYRFRDEKLDVIAARLARYYGIGITVTDPELGNMNITGSFPLDQPLGEVLELLNWEDKFVVRPVGRDYIIEKK